MNGLHIVVCGGLVPDPLQSLEPVEGPDAPSLKNEAMLPMVLDPWAAHALFEAAHLAANTPESKVWLVSLGPKARLQQLMMSVAQKASFELVALDGVAGGFIEPFETARALAEAIEEISDLDRSRLLLFGGCASASRDAGVTMPMVAERLGISEQFGNVDVLEIENGTLRIKERAEGGLYRVSECDGPPAMLAWATGMLPTPPNNPQLGMQNMRSILPALARAKPTSVASEDVVFRSVELPQQRRQTRVVKDASADEIAREIVTWIREG